MFESNKIVEHIRFMGRVWARGDLTNQDLKLACLAKLQGATISEIEGLLPEDRHPNNLGMAMGAFLSDYADKALPSEVARYGGAGAALRALAREGEDESILGELV